MPLSRVQNKLQRWMNQRNFQWIFWRHCQCASTPQHCPLYYFLYTATTLRCTAPWTIPRPSVSSARGLISSRVLSYFTNRLYSLDTAALHWSLWSPPSPRTSATWLVSKSVIPGMWGIRRRLVLYKSIKITELFLISLYDQYIKHDDNKTCSRSWYNTTSVHESWSKSEVRIIDFILLC